MINKSEAIKEMEFRIGLDVDELPRKISVFRNDEESPPIIKNIDVYPVPLFLLRKIFPDWISRYSPDELLFECYEVTQKIMPKIYPYLADQKEVFNFKRHDHSISIAYAEDCEEYRKQKESNLALNNNIQLKSETLVEMEARLGIKVDELPRRIMVYNNDEENFYLAKEICVNPISIKLLQQIFPECLAGEYPDECLIDSYEVTKDKVGYLSSFFSSQNELFDFKKYQYFFTVADGEMVAEYIKKSK